MTNVARKDRHAPLTAVREAMRTPGTPLSPRERAEFECAFGCDLSQIRIHTDATAASAAGAIDARAFTIGRDIFFAQGAFEPRTPAGRTAIAHEIAHALQDPRRVAVSEIDAAVEVTSPGDAAERDADAATDAIAAGHAPAPAHAPAASRPRIARLVAGLIDRRDPGDPAQLVARLSETVRTTLSNDPDDRLGRVRRSLLALDDRTRRLVFEKLESQLVSADWRHLIDVLDQPMPSGTEDGDGRELPADPSSKDEKADAAAERPAEAEEPKAPESGDKVHDAKTKDAAAPPLVPDAEHEAKPAAHGKPVPRAAHPKLQGAKPRHAAAARAMPPAKARKPVGGGGPPPPIMAGGGAPEPAEPAGPSMAEAPVESEAERRAGAQVAQMPEPPKAEAAEAAMPAEAGPEGDAGTAPADPEGEETEILPRAETAPSPAQAPAPAPQPDGASVEEAPSAPAPPAEETAPPPAQDESAGKDAASELQSEAAAPDATTPEGEETATRVRPGEEAAPGDATAAPEQDGDGEVTATRVSRAPRGAPSAGAAPAGAMPQIGDLPPEQDDGHEERGGGGGGGASAIPDAPEEAPPVVPANADPASAMESVASLDPVPAQQALGGVSAAVDRSVAADRGELANAPPEAKPPAAPPGGAAAKTAAAATAAKGSVAKLPAAAAPAATAVQAPPPPSAPIPDVPTPRVTSNAEGQLTDADARHINESVDALPVSDPALNVTAGTAPTLKLDGATDPERAAAQRAEVAKASQAAAETARQDAAQPMGEDHIVPTVPSETLRGAVPATAKSGGAAGPGGGSGATGEVDIGVAAVAGEKSGEQVRAAAMSGSQDLAAKRAEQQQKMTQARDDSQRDMDNEVAKAGAAQDNERHTARGEVAASRRQWGSEQRDVLGRADADSEEEVVVARRQARDHQKSSNAEAEGHIADGNNKIKAARTDAEQKARAERQRAKEESKNQGFFSRVASAIGDFFDGIRKAIHAAFDFARKLVADAIAAAQKLAAAVIDRVRDAVVGLIELAGKALIAIGDRVLAAFPTLREKLHKAIDKLVHAAVDAVNKIAEGLKKAVKALLDLLGKALTMILDAYEALYMAAVNFVAKAINAAINAAKAVIQALGVFAALIRDIASNPGAWLRNFGAALLDGVRNHLWKALKAAIKEWFNSKVEAVVGIGKLIFEVLKKGGIPFKRIAAMVWVAVKAAIPRAIIEFLIQKVISLLVPAAAAIMAIIEGLQAAWATVSRIIAAIERFVAFLKAVKGGNAGPQFANAVAAAAVAVIDFTANFIISKIGKSAKGVGGKLSAIASKIMAFLKKGVKAIGRVLKKVGKAIVRAVKAVGRALKAAVKWIANSKLGKALRAAGRWLANTKLGKAIAKAYNAIKKKVKETKEKIKKWWEKRNSPEAKQARLDKAVAAIRPRAQALLQRGIASPLLTLRLAAWQLFYGLSRLYFDGNNIVAVVNPRAEITDATALRDIGKRLEPMLAAAEAKFFERLAGLRSEDEKEHLRLAREEAEGGSNMASGLQGASLTEFYHGLGGMNLSERTSAKGRAYLMVRPGTAANLVNRLKGGTRLLSLVFVAGAPAYANMTPEQLQRASVGDLTDLESARSPGMYAGQTAARGLVRSGYANQMDTVAGELAPMASVGSGRAAEVDVGQRQEAREDTKRRRQDDRSREIRHERLGKIFERLRATLRNPPTGQILTNKEQSAAMDRLADAFEKWLNANITGNTMATEEAAPVLAVELEAKLVAFLIAFR